MHTYAKSLLLLDHKFDDRLPDDEDLALSLLPVVDSTSIRRNVKDDATVGPLLAEIDIGSMKNFERDLDRSSRRKRRHTQRSRRQVILPDREPLKTHRSRVPSIFDPPEVAEQNLEKKDMEADSDEESKDPLRQQFFRQRATLAGGKLPESRTFAKGGVQPKITPAKNSKMIEGLAVLCI